jgi:hypothetical protein
MVRWLPGFGRHSALQLKRPTTTGNSPAQPVRTAAAVVSSAIQRTAWPKRVAQPSVKVPPAPQIDIAPIPTDRMLNTWDAAKILGETHEVLKKWRQRDQGPEYIRFPNGDIRYRLSTLLKFIEDHTVRPELPVSWQVSKEQFEPTPEPSKRLA